MGDRESSPTRRRAWLIAATIYALLFFVAYLIVNASSISGWFRRASDILAPIFGGMVIAYLCNPILKLFDEHLFRRVRWPRVRRALAITCTYIVVIAILIFIVVLLIPEVVSSVQTLRDQYDNYTAQALRAVNDFVGTFTGNSALLDEQAISAEIGRFIEDSGNWLNLVADWVKSYGFSVISGVSNILVALIISVYFMFDKERRLAQCKKAIAALFNRKNQDFITRAAQLANNSFGGFIEGKILDSAIIAVLTYVVLLIFRIPFPVLVAFIVGVTNIVPVFGPIVGAILSAFIIFIVSPSQTIWFLVLILIIQQLDGNVIGPKILGNNIGVSAFCIITSIVVMGSLFGFAGMVIGVPVFAVLIVLVTDYLNERLKKKSLSTDSASYLGDDHGMLQPRFKTVTPKRFLFRRKKADASRSDDTEGTADGNKTDGSEPPAESPDKPMADTDTNERQNSSQE